ncbi:MAG: Flp family type IVb pilin [Rhodoblastus sp.]|nr:MAG: Flp family type IVb pilin [Rhodoblastus sp.]
MFKQTSFLEDGAGATAIEYSLIAMFIALAIIAGATTLGSNVSNIFNKFGNTFS